ncbi:hypothetical protein N9Z02_00815 [Akkermansiaceae bacterium]|nr:hypothetical protein [Akkermansiaceae bacterium]
MKESNQDTKARPPSNELLNLLVGSSLTKSSHATPESSDDLLKRLRDSVDHNLTGITEATPERLATCIRFCQQHTKLTDGHLKNLESYKRILCWVIGKMLMAVKSQLGKGDMKQWRKDHLQEIGLSESSADNYISLAKKFDDTESLIADPRPLRELYGSAEKESKELPDGTSPPPISRSEKVLKDCTMLQRDLRLLKDCGETLSKEQVEQLKFSKETIDQDFEAIISA